MLATIPLVTLHIGIACLERIKINTSSFYQNITKLYNYYKNSRIPIAYKNINY
jgi:hypothetical protein